MLSIHASIYGRVAVSCRCTCCIVVYWSRDGTYFLCVFKLTPLYTFYQYTISNETKFYNDLISAGQQYTFLICHYIIAPYTQKPLNSYLLCWETTWCGALLMSCTNECGRLDTVCPFSSSTRVESALLGVLNSYLYKRYTIWGFSSLFVCGGFLSSFIEEVKIPHKLFTLLCCEFDRLGW